MADNVPITAGTGTDIATDDVGSVHYQKVKLDGGGDGVATPILAGGGVEASALRVTLASDSTGVVSVDDNGATLSVDDGGGALTVDGTVAVTSAGITTIAGAVAGTEMQVDVLSSALPSGAATSAKQDSQTTLLGGGLPAALGAGGGLKVDGSGTGLPVTGTFWQATQPVSVAAAVPVTDNSTTLSVDDGGAALTVDGTVAVTNAGITTIAGAVAGTEMQVDVVSSALPSGASTSALQGGGLPAALGAGGGLKVDGSGTALPVSGTFWQGTQPVSAAALPLPTGASTAALQGGGLPAALGAGGGLKVDGSGTALPVSGTFYQATQPVSIATAPALVASTAYIGITSMDTTVVTVTPTSEAAAFHAGDVLFDSAEIASAARANGKGVELVSLVARDLDDQAAAALTLFFFNANTSLGTKNAAPDIDDTEILTLVGVVAIPAAAWIDVGASKVATMQNIGQLMHPGAASTSLWVAGMTAGTPTQTAAGISLTFQFVRY